MSCTLHGDAATAPSGSGGGGAALWQRRNRRRCCGTGTLAAVILILLAAAATKPAAASLMWVPLGGASECSAACASAGSGLAGGAVTSAAGKSVCGVLHAPWAELVAGTKLTGTPGCFYASPTAGASKALSGYSCLCAKGATTAGQVAQQACWRPATAPSCSWCGAGFAAFPMAHAMCRLTNASSVTPVAKRWTAGYVNSGSCKTVAGTRLYSTATSGQGQVGLLCAKATAAAPALVCYGAPTVKPPNSAETNGAGSCSGTATCALRCAIGYTGWVIPNTCTCTSGGIWSGTDGQCTPLGPPTPTFCSPNPCVAMECRTASCISTTGLCSYVSRPDNIACRNAAGAPGVCRSKLCEAVNATTGRLTPLDPFPTGAVPPRVASFSVVLPGVASLTGPMPDNAALTVKQALSNALVASSPKLVTKADVLATAATAISGGGGVIVPTRLPLACTDCGGARGAALDGYFGHVDRVLAALLLGLGLDARAPFGGIAFKVGNMTSASSALAASGVLPRAAAAAVDQGADDDGGGAAVVVESAAAGDQRHRRLLAVTSTCPSSYSLPAGFGGLAAPVLYAACCTPPAGKACASVGGEPNGCGARTSANNNVTAALTALFAQRAPGTDILAIPTSANMLSRFDDCCDANDFCFMTPGNGRADCDAAQHACALDACAAGCSDAPNNAACLSTCRDAAARLRAALLALDTSRDDLWALAQYDTLKYAATRCTVLPLVSGDTAPASLEECACRARGANYAWNAAKSLCACAAGFGGTQCRACTGNTASGGGTLSACKNCTARGASWISNPDHTACTCDSGDQKVCGPTCCSAGYTCVDPSAGTCCRSDLACGSTCCSDSGGTSCSSPETSTCCAPQNACGDACCNPGAGEQCANASLSLCCAAGRDCGAECCAQDQACWTDTGAPPFCCAPQNRCGGACCGSGEMCDPTSTTCTCVQGFTRVNGTCVCTGNGMCGSSPCCPAGSSSCAPLLSSGGEDLCCLLGDLCVDPVLKTRVCCAPPNGAAPGEGRTCVNNGRGFDAARPAECCPTDSLCGRRCCSDGEDCLDPTLSACCPSDATLCQGSGVFSVSFACAGPGSQCTQTPDGAPLVCSQNHEVCNHACCETFEFCAKDSARLVPDHCCRVGETLCGGGCCAEDTYCAWSDPAGGSNASFRCCSYGSFDCCSDGLPGCIPEGR